MPHIIQQRLSSLEDNGALPLLKRIRRGIEKESLRVQPDGLLAQSPHPTELGSALTHPNITTDYSEALLEFITPVFDDIAGSLNCLDELHRFVYSQLKNEEIIWVSSMPCILKGDMNIPVAQYGSSNVAKMKTIYRIGLGHRYGRLMQSIAGIHYNFSLPDELWPILQSIRQVDGDTQAFKTKSYFGLIRNFRRYFWLLIYLFGSAPAVCHTFLDGRKHSLEKMGKGTLYAPYGTSLRMGNLGYQSDAQAKLVVCYNDLATYTQTLKRAIHEPHADYEKIGVKVNGEYRQLNSSLLQIENEFYSAIRPKRVTQAGETPLRALANRGVEYIEARCVDVNPRHPLGIDEEQIRFIDLFLIFCLLQDSPLTNAAEYCAILANQQSIVFSGRDPQLRLNCNENKLSVKDWGSQIIDQLQPIAALFDRIHNSATYSATLNRQQAKLTDSNLTPSAQLLEEISQSNESYFRMAMQYAQQHQEYFASRPLSADILNRHKNAAAASIEKQLDIEQSDRQSFEEYLAAYYSQ